MSRVLDTWAGMTGTVLDFAGTTAPAGWLLCFGQSVLRSDYPNLFAAIGTTFGSVDATHFTLPDLRGRVAAGKDDMGGAAASRLTTAAGGVDGLTLGNAGGNQTHTLTTAQMPAHNHAVTDPGHNHTTNANAQGSQGSSGTGGPVIFAQWQAASNTSNTTGISIQNNGSGNAHPNVQPTCIMNKIIKT